MTLQGNHYMFFGHEVFPLGLWTDVGLAITSIVWLRYYLSAQERGNKRLMYVFGYLWLLHLPNSIYLIMEYRHILIQDGIADAHETPAVVVFSILSLVGLLIGLYQIYITTTRVSAFAKHKSLVAVMLSFMATWGAVLGVHDLVSLMGALFPPLIIVFTVKALTPEWVLFTLLMGTLLSLLSLVILKIFDRTSLAVAK